MSRNKTAEEILTRVPPNNIEAEQAVLGAMMIEQKEVWAAQQIITSADFYRPTHGMIFEAIVRVSDRDVPPNVITVQDELRNTGRLDDVGGMQYLMALTEQALIVFNVEPYAKIVLEKAEKRRLISTGSRILALGWEHDKPADEARQEAIGLMLETTGRAERSLRWMGQAVSDEYDAINERFQAGGIKPTIRTGIHYLDCQTLGFQPGLNLICGRPSNGKTALLMQVIRVSLEHGPFLCFSLETTDRSLARRLMSAESGVDLHTLRVGNLQGDEWERLADAAGKLHDLPVLLDSHSKHIDDITARTKQALLQYDIKAVLIDYVQIIDGKGRDEREVCSHVSKRLSALGLDYNIPIIGAAILNRDADRDVVDDDTPLASTRPMLKHIKGSGQFEQDAQLAVLINNPKRKTEDGRVRPAELLYAKQKDGATGVASCMWEPTRLRFANEYQQELPDE